MEWESGWASKLSGRNGFGGICSTEFYLRMHVKFWKSNRTKKEKLKRPTFIEM